MIGRPCAARRPACLRRAESSRPASSAPSGRRASCTCALRVTSFETSSPSNLSASNAGWPGWRQRRFGRAGRRASSPLVAAVTAFWMRRGVVAPLVPFGLHLLLRRRELARPGRARASTIVFEGRQVGVLVLDLAACVNSSCVGVALRSASISALKSSGVRRSSLTLVISKLGDLALLARVELDRRHHRQRVVVAGAGGAEELGQELLLRRPRTGDDQQRERAQARGRSARLARTLVGAIPIPPPEA